MIYYKELSEKIIGCAFEVYNILGNGFLEKVYENALMKELSIINLAAKNQVPITVYYKSDLVGEYFSDILVEEKIILELKVVTQLLPIHEAQLMHYLKATNYKVGYLLNFGSVNKLEFKRFVH